MKTVKITKIVNLKNALSLTPKAREITTRQEFSRLPTVMFFDLYANEKATGLPLRVSEFLDGVPILFDFYQADITEEVVSFLQKNMAGEWHMETIIGVRQSVYKYIEKWNRSERADAVSAMRKILQTEQRYA